MGWLLYEANSTVFSLKKAVIIVLSIVTIIVISGFCYYKHIKNNMLDVDGMIIIKELEYEI